MTLKFIRRASARGRVVELSGPVMDEELNVFDRLYLVTSGNAQWLIPEPTVEEVTGRVDKEGCSGLSVAWINGTLFTSASRDGADYCRAVLGLPER